MPKQAIPLLALAILISSRRTGFPRFVSYKKNRSQEIFYLDPDIRELGKLGAIINERLAP